MTISRYKIFFKQENGDSFDSEKESFLSYDNGKETWEEISESKSKYALISKEGVVLSFDAEDVVLDIVSEVESRWKKDSWIFIGNYGSEFASNNIIKIIRDNKTTNIPQLTGISRIAQHLDSNALIVNIANLKKIFEKKEFFGNFDNVFLKIFIESYRNRMISLIDSNLFAYIEPKYEDRIFSYKPFAEVIERDFWKENFLNHSFFHTKGEAVLQVDYKYLYVKGCKKSDYYNLIKSSINWNVILNSPKIYIIVRTQLNRLGSIYRLLNSIDCLHQSARDFSIEVVLSINNTGESKNESGIKLEKICSEYDFSIKGCFIENGKRFPRVSAMLDPLMDLNEDGSFVWYIDDDDFVMPSTFLEAVSYLNKKSILIADSVVFTEEWGDLKKNKFPNSTKYLKRYSSANFMNIFSGDNFIPICSVIYPIEILRSVEKKYKLLGDYNEDYSIMLLATKEAGFVFQMPIVIAGISYHGNNTVLEKNRKHWQESYVTFMREVINSGLMKDIFSNKNSLEFNNQIQKGFGAYLEIIYKAINVLRKKGIVSFVKNIFFFIKNGRKHFRDGINSLDD